MAALAQLISWWRTPKVPSEAQRVETLNSFRHKDVAVPMADVSGLNAALNGKASTAALNAIYDGVDAAGNTLKKLYNLILGINKSVVRQEAANYSIVMPAKSLLSTVVIVPTVEEQYIRIGTTEGDEDIMQETTVSVGGGSDNPFVLNKWFDAETTIYIYGVSLNTYFKFFIQ